MRRPLETLRAVATSAVRLLAVPAVLTLGVLAVAPPWVALLIVGVPVALLAVPLAAVGGVALLEVFRSRLGALRFHVAAHAPPTAR